MNIVTWFNTALIKYWYILGWRHAIEILFFSALFYALSLWLKKDKKNNLLPLFYGYCSLSFIGFALGLTSMTHFLFLFSPVTIMLFILVHQNTLQKNFVTIRNTKDHNLKTDWIGSLTHSLLVSINQNKGVMFIIEKEDNLESLLETPFILNTHMNYDVLDIVLSSSKLEPNKMIWIDHTGNVKGINALWNGTINKIWIEQNIQKTDIWQQEALMITSKSDAIFIKAHPEKRTFTIIAHKEIEENITTHQFNSIIQEYLKAPNQTQNEGEYTYERPQKHVSKQPRA